MASTDDFIRQILEESKKKTGKITAYHPRQSSKISPEEQAAWDQRAKEQAARETAVKRGLQGWITDIPGTIADLAVDLPYNLAQRAAGRRGENIKPLGAGEAVRSGLSSALGWTQPQAETGMQPQGDWLNDAITSILQAANPVALTAAGDPVAAARLAGQGAKMAGKGAAKMAENAAVRDPYFAGKLGSQRGVIKMPGGNWPPESTKALEGLKPNRYAADDRAMFQAELDDLLKQNAEYPGRHERRIPVVQGSIQEMDKNIALNNFIDKQLTRYIKNQMATPEDPIRALAEKGTLHFDAPQVEPTDRLDAKRQAFADKNGKWSYGQSRIAQNWEDAADRMVNIVPAETYQNFGSSNMSGKPGWEWINKVDPDTPLYGLNNGVSGARGGDPSIESLGFPHLIDELRNATNPASGLPRELLIKPESLSKLSVPQAVERVAKINEWRAAQKAEADAARAMNPATFTHKEYPEGYKWVELKMPEKAPEGWTENVKPGDKANLDPNYAYGFPILEDALKYEGETMGHCVGGYCPDVAEGRSRIYSLRDKKGQPHVTVEVEPGHPLEGHKNLNSAEKQELHNQVVAEHYGGREPDLTNVFSDLINYEKHPYFQKISEAYVNKYGMPAPSIQQIKGKANRAPNEEYLPYVQDFVKSGKWSDVGDFHNTGFAHKADAIFTNEDIDVLRSKGHDVPSYLTAAENSKFQNELYKIQTGKDPETGLPIEGMKRGGSVKSCNQDAMQMAVWDKAVRKNGGGGMSSILSGIDSIVTPTKRRIADLVQNPIDYAKQAFNTVGENIAQFNQNALKAKEGQELKRMGSVMGDAPQYRNAMSQTINSLMGVTPIGATVWHGSPHKFVPTAKNPLGEFDASKMGTGEGAQAYGHGHYVAESPGVAKTYQPRDFAHEEELLKLYKAAEKRRDYSAMDILENALMHKTPEELRGIHGEAGERVIKQIDKIPRTVGSLYKIDLPDEHIAKMLDWDKPLSQQSPEVRAAVQRAAEIKARQTGNMHDLSNDYAIKDLHDILGPQRLVQAGIPGIKYLDQGSRNAGEGTSNFVIFPGNEDLLTIKERMKKGGAIKKAARKADGGAVKQSGKITAFQKSDNLDAMRMMVMDKKLRKHHA